MSLEKSLAAHVDAWTTVVDVLADPEQQEGGRVWTRAEDILPEAVVRDGEPVVAAWGDVTWRAVPMWDDTEIASLWLAPEGEPTLPPHLDVAAEAEAVAGSLLQLLAEGGSRQSGADGLTGREETGEEQDTARLQQRLATQLAASCMDDHATAVTALVDQVRILRLTLRETLTAVDQLSPSTTRALLRTSTGRRAYRLARVAAPAAPAR